MIYDELYTFPVLQAPDEDIGDEEIEKDEESKDDWDEAEDEKIE